MDEKKIAITQFIVKFLWYYFIAREEIELLITKKLPACNMGEARMDTRAAWIRGWELHILCRKFKGNWGQKREVIISLKLAERNPIYTRQF